VPFLNITPEQLVELKSNDNNVLLIDCRTIEEINQFSLDYDLHLDLTDNNILNRINNLDKDTKYIIYCHSGVRSQFLCNYLSQNGFKNLYNLDGGIIAFIDYLNKNQLK
jgi:rhodanese-related sulfurtransferase